MPVDIRGHRSRSVAEPLRDDAHQDARLQRKGATGVPEVVEPQFLGVFGVLRRFSRFAETGDSSRDRARISVFQPFERSTSPAGFRGSPPLFVTLMSTPLMVPK